MKDLVQIAFGLWTPLTEQKSFRRLAEQIGQFMLHLQKAEFQQQVRLRYLVSGLHSVVMISEPSIKKFVKFESFVAGLDLVLQPN